ncbi:hypothetical protein BAY59_38620 (plasmid) [Prauserella coralliicola]|nr:hypothetical protein BAY59_38620 [Prauserella coralliicola]
MNSSPAIAAVQRLLRFGFERIPVLDEDGLPEVLIFLRDWRGWREVVLVYSEWEARAYRTPVAFASSNPLYCPPGTAETLIPLADVVSVVYALLKDWTPPPHPAVT